MHKNIIVLTAMHGAVDISYLNICINTWKYWCNKNDVNLLVLDEPITDTSYMKPTWQRWHVFDILDANEISYDQVALVDIDTMIKWDAPNFFELTDHQFSVCSDNDNVGWVIESINGYKKLFPEITLDWTEYFNCGFIVMNSKHKSLCNTITKFWADHADTLISMQAELRKGTDQTPVNYIAKELTDIHVMNKKWNLTHLNRKELLNNMLFIDAGFIWHFNGFEKDLRLHIMNTTWEHIKHYYEN